MNNENVMEREFGYDMIEELLTVNTSSAYHFEQEQAEQSKRECSLQCRDG